MRKRLVLGCSALLLTIFALGSTPASACGGYYGYGYGYGCGCPSYGYAAYYVPPAYAYYALRAPIYRARWSYAPRAYYGWRTASWRGVGWRAAGWRGVGWRGGWRGGRRW